MTLTEALRTCASRLERAGVPSPQSDAEQLLGVVLGKTRADLILSRLESLTPNQATQFENLTQRREAREPLQWIVGFVHFYGLKLEVAPGVLIPRPETETLVALVLQHLPKTQTCHVADVGCGTGAIALALKHERPDLAVFASDINPAALALTQRNSQALGLPVRVQQMSLLQNTPHDSPETFDAVVSNPPYLPQHDAPTLMPEVQAEPANALFSGEDGLDLAHGLATQAATRLRTSGLFALELDPRNAPKMAATLAQTGWRNVTLHPDLVGRERFVLATR